MINSPILKLPDFSKQFLVEMNVSYGGLGVVLIQENHPLAFLSKAFGVKNMGLSVYEKEFLSIILAFDKLKSYLLHSTFVIRTDQQSLKYLLEHNISTTLQHTYLTKLLGFDYTIEHRKGKENIVADALQRMEPMEGEVYALTTVRPAWVEEIQDSYESDPLVSQTITEKLTTPYNLSLLDYSTGLVRYKERLYVGVGRRLRLMIMEYMHNSVEGGHSGIKVTFHRIYDVNNRTHLPICILYLTFITPDMANGWEWLTN